MTSTALATFAVALLAYLVGRVTLPLFAWARSTVRAGTLQLELLLGNVLISLVALVLAELEMFAVPRLLVALTAVAGAALGGDAYVMPAYRRHGLGRMLHEASRRAMAENDIACMFGAPGAMNVTPLVGGGSRVVGDVTRWARPLRGALGIAARTVDVMMRASPAALEPMLPYDGRVDLVWRAAREELRLATVRNAAFYTWRFLEPPECRQVPYVIIADGLPIGACALEPIEDGRVMRIVDVFAIPGAWNACLGAIARHVTASSRARVLDIKLMAADGRRRRMWASAFREREGKPFLCMPAEGADRRLTDEDRWFYSGADSDLAALT